MLQENSIFLEIELKRKEMDRSALENGLNSANTIKISQELDNASNAYADRKL